MKDELILYSNSELKTTIEIKLEDETLWLTQNQIVVLFKSSKANISEHIKHIFQTGELEEEATVRFFRTVRKEGKRNVNRDILHYSLDVIISVGYRVNSIRGTQFRVWANRILKEHLLNGFSINKRINRIEDNVDKLVKKVNEIDLHINTNLPPKQGIFFDGQIFDSYTFITDLVKKAQKSIILIDNYIDESVFTILSKRKDGVEAIIYTKTVDKKLSLDISKHNQQYSPVQVLEFGKSHDRFIIIDRSIVYHIGASLKDLGKRWFAFSKLEIDPNTIINNLS